MQHNATRISHRGLVTLVWAITLTLAGGPAPSAADTGDNASDAEADTSTFGEIFLDIRAAAEQRLADVQGALESAPAFHDRETYEAPLMQWKQRLEEKLADLQAEDGPIHRASTHVSHAVRQFEEAMRSAPFRELDPPGDGSTDEPYEIDSIDALQLIGIEADAHFVLTADIDASATAEWNDGAGFEPIGSRNAPFTGTLDGNGHAIIGLTIDRDGGNDAGLFGTADGTIRNLTLREPNVRGQRYVAALFGRGGADVSNVRIESARIEGERRVGGIAGRPSRSRIERTAVVGGSIQANREVGGIVGRSTSSTSIYKSYTQIRVEGERDVGGLVGHTSGVASTFEQVYAAGEVVGERSVGGLAGGAGSREDNVQAVYWDRQATGQDASAIGQPLESSQMRGDEAASYLEGFDFDEIWETVADDYPALRD